MSTTTITPTRRTAGVRITVIVLATLAAVAVWAVAHSVLDIDLKAKSFGEVNVRDVATAPTVVGLLAWALLSRLERTSANPRKAWTTIASIVFVLSLLGPASGEGTSAKLTLACLHLVVALVLVPGYARTVKQTQEG